MALDGALFDKPAVYIAYSPDNAPHFDYATKVHGEDHFKVLHDIEGVGYIYKKKDLFPFIKNAVTDADSVCKDRKVFLERITDNIIAEAGGNLVKALEKIHRNQ